MGDKKTPPPKTIPGWLNFIIGGGSGMLATCFVQPADLVKTRMQLMGPAGKNMSTFSVASDILKKEGPLGFYSGLSAALFRQATYTTGRMGCFNSMMDYYKTMLAICIVQPADLVKTRMQLMGPGKNMSTFSVASDILKNEGPLGFYSGLSAALFRQATYTTGRMGCFNSMMDFHKSTHGTPNFLAKIGMGVTAGGIGAFIGTPAEVALIRMTADGRLPPDQRRNYKNVFNALSRIISEEGVTALWRGGMATVTRAMVVNGAQLSTYAQAREALLSTIGEGIALHFCASMISGFVTSAASLPVDIVKTRVQNAAKGASQLGVLMSVIKNEGVLALWSGFLPTYAKIGPHTVLTFIFLEQLNKLYMGRS